MYLGTYTKNEPNVHKIYEIVIYQNAPKYTKFKNPKVSIPRPSKIFPNWYFWYGNPDCRRGNFLFRHYLMINVNALFFAQKAFEHF
jgi:hypothetical protein